MIVQAMNVCNCVHALCGVKTEYGSFLLNQNALNQVLVQCTCVMCGTRFCRSHRNFICTQIDLFHPYNYNKYNKSPFIYDNCF